MDNGASSYRRFLCGDDSGIAELIEEYKDGLMLYLNGYVNNLFTAEELTEDVFYRLVVKRPKYSGKSSFKTWLYGIGRNVAVDHIRHSSRYSGVPIEDMAQYLADKADLERSYIQEQNKQLLHGLLHQLPLDYRNVIWLVYFEGFSNREAARILKKSDRQIANLLYRAKQSLKSRLEKEGYYYEEQ